MGMTKTLPSPDLPVWFTVMMVFTVLETSRSGTTTKKTRLGIRRWL